MNNLNSDLQKGSRFRAMGTKLRNGWQKLTAPSDKITDVADRQQAQLLASLTLVLALGNIFGVMTTVAVGTLIGFVPLWSMLAITAVVLLLAYGISRTSNYIWAAVIAVGILLLPAFITFFNPPQNDYELLSTYVWLIMPLLLGSLFFSYRGQVALSLVAVSLLLLLPIAVPTFDLSVGQVASFLIIAAVIILFVKYQREQVNKTRRKELIAYNQVLQITQAVTENIPGVVYQFALRPDNSTYFPYISKYVYDMLGLDPDLLQENGEPLLQLIHPEDRNEFDELLAQSAQNGASFHWQGRFQLPDNHIVYVQANANFQSQQGGDNILWNGTLLDVTELEQALTELGQVLTEREQALTERGQALKEVVVMEARAQAILESVTVPLLISSLESGTVLYANQLLSDMVRVPLNDLIGQLTPDFYFNPADRPTLLARIQEYGHVSDYEIRLKRADGEPFWALISIQITDFQGTPALITTLLDIESRKVMERQLVERVQQLNLLNEIGRKADETPSIARFLQWVAEHIPPAMSYSEDCVAAISLDDAVYGAVEAKELPRHIIEELRLSGDQTGRIYIAYTQNHEFYNAESAFISDIGRRVSSYIENQRLVEETQVRAAELQIVAEVGTTIAATRNIQQLLNNVVELTKERFHMYHAQIYLLDQVNNDLVLSAGAGKAGQQMVTERRVIPLQKEQSLVAQAARTRRGVIVNDVQHEPGFLPHPLLPETAAEIAVPLVFGEEELLGVLDIQSDSPGYFNTGHINIFTTLASQVAIALQNARQAEQTQEALQELRALQQVMTGEGWQAFMTNPERSVSGYVAVDQNQVQPVSEAIPANGDSDDVYVVPMTVRGVPIGGLGIKNGDALSEAEKGLLDNISQQVAEALERARLFEETEMARTQTEALYAASDRIARAETIEDVLQALVDSTALQRMDRVSVMLFDHPWQDEMPEFMTAVAVIEQAEAEMPMPAELRFPLAQFPDIGHISRDEPLITEDMALSERIDEQTRELLVDMLGIRGAVIFPLVVAGQWIGLLAGQSKDVLHIDEMEVRQIENLTDQAATAIQNQRLLAESQERVQQEQILRQVSERVYGAVDAESVLKTAVQEVGRTLGLQAFIYLDEPQFSKPQTKELQPTNGDR